MSKSEEKKARLERRGVRGTEETRPRPRNTTAPGTWKSWKRKRLKNGNVDWRKGARIKKKYASRKKKIKG